MKESSIAAFVVILCGLLVWLLCQFTDMDYDMTFVKFMLIYLLIDKIKQTIKNDKQ